MGDLTTLILVLKAGLDEEQICAAESRLAAMDLSFQRVATHDRLLVVITDDARTKPANLFSQIEAVEKVIGLSDRHPLSSGVEEASNGGYGGIIFGGTGPVIIAGPCSVESREQILATAAAVKDAGAHALRAGAFKPRTSPYDFSGLGFEGLAYLSEARQATGLPVVSEILSPSHIEPAYDHIDVFQVGARNMYNYELLRELGRTDKSILLKRAMSATVDEFLQAAEYILLGGNPRVILCERGIRTFETRTRNTLDLNSVALIKTMTNLPVVVDPSHGTGRSQLVLPLSNAAVACGADGLLIETHLHPHQAMSDADQAITPETLKRIIDNARAIFQVLGNDQAGGAQIPATAHSARPVAVR
jgi:3-deoxy-7-phosphoheptulonate synthase